MCSGVGRWFHLRGLQEPLSLPRKKWPGPAGDAYFPCAHNRKLLKIGHHEYSDASAGSRIALLSVLWYLLKPWKLTITWHKYVVNSYHPHSYKPSKPHLGHSNYRTRTSNAGPCSFCTILRYNILLSSSSPSSVLEFDVQCKKTSPTDRPAGLLRALKRMR